jgi:hypothetical protein
MGLIPDRNNDVISFGEAHAPIWTANYGAIGLSTTAAASVTAATTTARAAFTAAENAKTAYHNAVTAQNNAIAALRNVLGDSIRTIRAYGNTQSDPTVVWTKAAIPAPAAPTPMAPPGECKNFVATLENNGAVTLTFKCTNPTGASGTSYIVKRATTSAGPFVYLGTVGKKKFTDETIPAGINQVFYTVQGVRADSAGPVTLPFSVTFGSVGGQSFAQVDGPSATVKLAA